MGLNILVKEECVEQYNLTTILYTLLNSKEFQDIRPSELFHQACEKVNLCPFMHQIIPLLTNENLLVTTSTGSGKTAAALLAFLASPNSVAFFAYPTNALVENQIAAMLQLMSSDRIPPSDTLINLKADFLTAENLMSQNIQNIDIILVPLSGQELFKFQKKLNTRTRGQALETILKHLNPWIYQKRIIFLGTPDVLFLMALLRYKMSDSSLQIISRLRTLQFLVLDEFHMYYGPTLAKILGLVLFFQRVPIFSSPKTKKRILLLSATPLADQLDFLPDLLDMVPYESSNAYQLFKRYQTTWQFNPPRLHRVTHSINLHLMNSPRRELIPEIFASIIRKYSSPKHFEFDQSVKQIPAVIIMNSVTDVIALERPLADLLKSDFRSVKVYRGLMSQLERDINFEKTDILLGTSAIEVGIDFDTILLLMECSSADSVIQRFGRAARKNPAVVFAFIRFPEFKTLKHILTQLSQDSPFPRNTVLNVFNQIFDQPRVHTEFLRTMYACGLISLFLANWQNLELAQDQQDQLQQWNDDLVSWYAKKLNISDDWRKIHDYAWFRKYRESVQLRGGFSQTWILSTFEEQQNRNPFFQMSVPNILHRTEYHYNSSTVVKLLYRFFHKKEYLFKDISSKAENIPIITQFAFYNKLELTTDKFRDMDFTVPLIVGESRQLGLFNDPNSEDPIFRSIVGTLMMILPYDKHDLTDWRTIKLPFRWRHFRGFIVFSDDVLLYKGLLN